MSKIFVGAKAQNLDIGAEVANITRVNLVVDSDHMYTAGNDTGRTIEVECPWGTQAMANSILARVGGVNYKPFSAERALLDPAFEIGDAVTVGDVYSQIAGADCTYNGAALVTIEAPELDEIDDEYPAQQTQQSSTKRQLAYTRSLITKTAEQIRLEVEATDGRITALSVTLDGVTIMDENGETRIKGSSIDTSTIKANSITADMIDASELKVNAANITGALTFGQLAEDVQNDINDAYSMAEVASEQFASLTYTYGGNTYIDESMLMTERVIASNLMGGTVSLLAADETVIGTMDIVNTSTGYGLGISTGVYGGGIKIAAGGGNVYLESSDGAFLKIGYDENLDGPVCQLGGGPLIVPGYSYGTSLPRTGTYGQVFFLLES